MRMNEISFEGQPPVDAYGKGGFRLAGDEGRIEGSHILLPSAVLPWAVGAASEISPETIAPILAAAAEIDVILMGMGSDIAAITPEARTAFEDAGIGVELMSTAAACRTYNVLLSEGRRVGAALIAV